jgi:AcrR family transcriptional regulator
MMAPMSPRAAAMAPDDRRQAIIDVVVPLLLDHGGEVSTREIAEAAGIAEGTIFRVFPDKNALWLAVAERTLDPQAERDELNEAIAGATDLYTKIERAADHLLQRSQRVMAVMMLLRGMWMRQAEHDSKDHRTGEGPPFIVEANRALMSGLTELFEAHRSELAVGPQTAAAVLRSLVLGQRHPGAHADYLLSPAEVAEVMLHGVMRARS